MKRLISLALLAIVALPPPSYAVGPCGPHSAIVRQLTQLGEVRHATAMEGPYLIEIFVSEKGTWTVVRTDPRRWSCLLNFGLNFEVEPQPDGEPA